MASRRKGSGVGSRRGSRASPQERMEKAAKAVFELPPLEDQEEWEAGMLAELHTGDLEGNAMFRRKTDSDTWHWRSDCGNWPTSDYVSKPSKPSTGELCNQCQAKDRQDEVAREIRRL